MEHRLPRFGFLGRFSLGSGSIGKSDSGFACPWEIPSKEKLDSGACILCVAKNPLLEELFLWRTANGAVVFDGRIDEIGGEKSGGVNGTAESRPVSTLSRALVSGKSLAVDFLKRVIGDFCIVQWNEERRVLRLARDAFGARSLFYFIADNVVTVSSDLGLLIGQVGGPLAIDWVQARAWLVPTTDPVSLPDRTILRGVRRVIPGTLLEICESGINTCRFWSPEEVGRETGRTLDEAVDSLSAVVSRSIADRIPNEGQRFACHLSGGLDCSTICGFIVRNHADALDRGQFVSWTPSVVFEAGRSELDVVARLAKAWGIRPTHVGLEALEAAYREWNAAPFDPCRNSTMVAAESVGLESLSNDCAVMLSGWGGDEFASSHGWGLPTELLLGGRWFQLWRFLIRSDPNYGWAAVRGSLLRFCRWLVPAAVKHIFGKLRFAKKPLIGDPFRFRLTHVNYHSSVRSAQTSAYWSGHLVERIEAWAALGRSQGVQYTYPLLDRRVVECALSMPGWHFGDGRESRVVFRRMASRIWPDGLAGESRKWEPGLASLVRKFSLPPSELQKVEAGIVKDVLADAEILKILPRRLRKLLTIGGVRRGSLQPYLYGLKQIRDSARWVRAENEARKARSDETGGAVSVIGN